MPQVTVWAKFDIAIQDGSVAPLEIIDWTFGRRRVQDEKELLRSLGAQIYRLVAGAQFQGPRPIAITEVHVPTMQQLTVVPKKSDVVDAWNRVARAAGQIQAAITDNHFPPKPGPQCGHCPYQRSCPATLAGSGELPL